MKNFITQNLRHRKEYCISKKKKLLKQCQKEVIYEHILAFAGLWSILWDVVGSGGHILAGGLWWWIYFAGGGWREWWWLVVGVGGYILAGGGWWWMVVGLGG